MFIVRLKLNECYFECYFSYGPGLSKCIHKLRRLLFLTVIQAVKLNSTLEFLRGEYVTYPQQRVYFMCTTTGSNIQEWYSNEYITGIDDRIQLHEGRRTGSGRAANTTIISITVNELGEKVVISRLSLVASTQFLVSTVSCGNNGYGMRDNITFSKQDR